MSKCPPTYAQRIMKKKKDNQFKKFIDLFSKLFMNTIGGCHVANVRVCQIYERSLEKEKDCWCGHGGDSTSL